MTEAIDAALDPDPEVRPLASELERCARCARRRARRRAAAGDRGPRGRARSEHAPAPADRPLPARRQGVAALGLAALIATGAPAPDRAGGAGPGCPRPRPRPPRLRAAARPRPALAGDRRRASRGSPPWSPLLGRPSARCPRSTRRRSPCRASHRSSGSPGLGPVYPALAGLTRGAAGRALLGGIGYLWLAAWEELAHRDAAARPGRRPAGRLDRVRRAPRSATSWHP